MVRHCFVRCSDLGGEGIFCSGRPKHPLSRPRIGWGQDDAEGRRLSCALRTPPVLENHDAIDALARPDRTRPDPDIDAQRLTGLAHMVNLSSELSDYHTALDTEVV